MTMLTKKTNRRPVVSLVALFLFFVVQQTSAINLFPEVGKKSPSAQEQKQSKLPFFSVIKQKEQEYASLESEREETKKRAEEARKSLEEPFNLITYDLGSAKDELEKTGVPKSEFINKKITLLNDRKQNLNAYLDLFKEVEDVIVERASVLENYISFLKNKQKLELKPLYSWQEFREEQAVISRLNNKLNEIRIKKDALAKQESTEKETIESLQRQIEVKTKERLKLSNDKDGNQVSLNLEADVFNQEIKFLEEKVTTLKLRLTKLATELRLKENEIDFIQAQLASHKNDLASIDKLLAIDLRDVENARNEASAEREKSMAIKEDLAKKIEAKNIERSKLEARKEKAVKDRKRIEARDKRDTAEFRVVKSEEQKIAVNLDNILQSIKLLQVKGERADAEADEKDVLYKMVDFRYKLSKSKIDLEESLAKFKSLKDLAAVELNKLHLERESIDESQRKDTKELELLNMRKEEVLSLKEVLFATTNNLYLQVLRNIDLTEKAILDHRNMSHTLLVDKHEVISSREKIINKYNLIIQDIENLIIDQGIWKRSPHAISWETIQVALIEAENFFVRFFWNTPDHLGPKSLLTSAKEISFTTILMVILFICFFMISSLAIRLLLGVMLRRVRHHLSTDHKQIGFLWFNIVASILEFFMRHLTVLFTLLFLYLHIFFRFSYIFSTISFLNNDYNQVLLHLVSIPIYLYLSQSLLGMIKDLNKRLSFLFFAEKLEDRFILLINVFCYSTAIIIPLRQAVLSDSIQSTALPNVLLTMYSLVLAVIWLLFFSKDVMLRLLPFQGTFFDWVRRGIDLHYYPVFFFCMGLLMLPLVGYSNLAWFLAFALPSTVLIFYAALMVHYYIRKYALFIFMKEEDEEIVDKFEYAKTYYGLMIISTFLFLLFASVSISAHMWHIGYTPAEMWKLLSDHWVIRIGADNKFGIIEFFTLIIFFVAGFVFSSLIQRFVLNKIFDILRTEPGMQNTVSKIIHYATITFAVILGLTSVHLDQLLVYVGAVSAVAIGFVLKDVAADYVSGLFILIERPVEIGNFVAIDQDPNKRGVIHKIDARTTTIVNRLNHSLIIPNKDVTTKLVANWGKGRFAVGFEMMIHISYFEDLALIRETITDVLQSNPTILRVPRITVRMEDFNNVQFTYLVRAFISSRRVREQWDIAADLRESLFKAFAEKGIEFAVPTTIIYSQPLGAKNTSNPGSPVSFTFDE